LIWESNRANKKGIHAFFTKFHHIAEKIELTYQHIDLFYFRETNQKEAKKIVDYNDINHIPLLNDF
jgi:hypothetical protein